MRSAPIIPALLACAVRTARTRTGHAGFRAFRALPANTTAPIIATFFSQAIRNANAIPLNTGHTRVAVPTTAATAIITTFFAFASRLTGKFYALVSLAFGPIFTCATTPLATIVAACFPRTIRDARAVPFIAACRHHTISDAQAVPLVALFVSVAFTTHPTTPIVPAILAFAIPHTHTRKTVLQAVRVVDAGSGQDQGGQHKHLQY